MGEFIENLKLAIKGRYNEEVARENVARCLLCALYAAGGISVALLVLNIFFLDKRIIHMILPCAFWAVMNGAFSVLLFSVLKQRMAMYYTALAYVFFVCNLIYMVVLAVMSMENYGNIVFYYAAVIMFAYVIYSNIFHYLLVVAVEIIALLVISIVTRHLGFPLQGTDYVVAVVCHIFAFALSRDSYGLRTETYHQIDLASQETKKAECDPLTGLVNRRGLENQIKTDVAKLHGRNTYVGAIILDIDHFKKYNDGFGHQKGDECLVRVAKSVQQTVKDLVGKKGVAARIGGEEFMVFVRDLEPIEVLRLAEKIRVNVEAMRLKHATGPGDVVTISLGAYTTILDENGLSYDTMYNTADKYLYQSKNRGRNRVYGNKAIQ